MGNELTRFQKGKAPGRPPGATNKLQRTIRDTFMQVFNMAQNDPKMASVSLVEFAKKDPRTFYLICGKIIPQEVVSTIDHNIHWMEERNYKGISEPAPSIIDIPHEVVKPLPDDD